MNIKNVVMRYLLIVTTMFFTVQGIAQNSKRTSAYNYLRYFEIEKAQKAIDEAVEHEQTKDDPKTWLYRGQIYYVIDTSSQFKYLHKQPLDIALNSFERTGELDDKGRYERQISGYLQNIALQFFNRGVAKYNAAIQTKQDQDFQSALNDFENYLRSMKLLGDESSRIENILKQNDINPDDVLFYAGYAANKIGNKEKAKEYLGQLVTAKYDNPMAYMNLANIHLEEQDTSKALNVVQKGKTAVTDDKDLVVKELQIYEATGRTNELVKNLEAAIAKDPDKVNLYLVLGSTYDALSKSAAEDGNKEQAREYLDKALNNYKTALEKDPDNYDANYNLGINFYNEGVEIINEAQEMKDYKKAAEKENEAKEEFKKGLPYLEKAFDIDCSDQNLFNSLKTIYARTNQYDKIKTLQSEYQNCGQE